MHPNPAFRGTPVPDARAFARARGFGVLTIPDSASVLAAHVPFVLDDGGDRLEAHLVRSNPIARRLKDGPTEALLVVSGPDAYISPDWYGEADRVPTWNYIAVHLRGRLSLKPHETMRDHLDRLSAAFEEQLRPKTPWTAAKMTPDVLDRMMRQIVPVEVTGISIDSTFKLNQNRTDAARERAAAHLSPDTPGQETAALAAMMRSLQPE